MEESWCEIYGNSRFSGLAKAAQAGDIKPEDRKIVEVEGEFIAIFNVDGQYYAIEDICSHDDGSVAEGELEDYEIVCPHHGARFDIRDGRVLSFPAITPIWSYPVKIEGSDILIEIE
jgi:3-phenylpropionate/trans-cinnamate dioxygenase ferredoxin subunit